MSEKDFVLDYWETQNGVDQKVIDSVLWDDSEVANSTGKSIFDVDDDDEEDSNIIIQESSSPLQNAVVAAAGDQEQTLNTALDSTKETDPEFGSEHCEVIRQDDESIQLRDVQGSVSLLISRELMMRWNDEEKQKHEDGKEE
jgi:hypothetical protein